MAKLLRVKFGEPKAGWLLVELHSGGVDVSFGISYIVSDLRQFVEAVHSLSFAEGSQSVLWYAEPTEYEMRFCRDKEMVHFQIVEFPDGGRTGASGIILLDVSGPYAEIALPLWRAMRALQGRCTAAEFAERWKAPFPVDALNKWTDFLRERGLLAR